jgi:hypothetical protein
MADREGGQWNVATKEDAVYLERADDSGERLFDDLLEPHEARQLARLLKKYADKLGESEESDESDDDESDDDDKSDDDKSDDDESDDDESDEDDKSDDSDESDDSEKKSSD